MYKTDVQNMLNMTSYFIDIFVLNDYVILYIQPKI